MSSVLSSLNSLYVHHVNVTKKVDCIDHFDYLVEDFQDALHEAFPSVYACNRWIDQDRQAIAHNNFAQFGITQKNDRVSIFVTPKPVPKVQIPLRDAWISQIGKSFSKVTQSTFQNA